MELFRQDNTKVIISDEILKRPIKHGNCGTIYYYKDDTCLKLYDQKYAISINKLKIDIYNDIKEIISPNLINIKEIYFKEKKNVHYDVDAFISQYYEEAYDDFLNVSTTYLLENIEQILKLSNELSKKRIRFFDIKRENIILDSKNIILIDPDRWYYSNLDFDEIRHLNINSLSTLFNELTRKSLQYNHKDYIIENKLLACLISDKLFPITSNANRTMKVLTKRLEGYNRPIDYFYDMKK